MLSSRYLSGRPGGRDPHLFSCLHLGFIHHWSPSHTSPASAPETPNSITGGQQGEEAARVRPGGIPIRFHPVESARKKKPFLV